MDNNLQQALANIITRAMEGVDKSIEFLGDQLPDVINQLLVWKMVYHGLLAALGGALLIGVIVGMTKGFKIARAKERAYHEEHGHPSGDQYFLFSVLSAVLGVPATIVGVALFNLTWLQILIAPKIYLIEYAATLVKGS